MMQKREATVALASYPSDPGRDINFVSITSPASSRRMHREGGGAPPDVEDGGQPGPKEDKSEHNRARLRPHAPEQGVSMRTTREGGGGLGGGDGDENGSRNGEIERVPITLVKMGNDDNLGGVCVYLSLMVGWYIAGMILPINGRIVGTMRIYFLNINL
jgi:hypothetical protein